MQFCRLTIVAAISALCTGAIAQQAATTPRVGYVFPAGAQRGTTIEVAVGGATLDGVAGAYVSGEGVKAEIIEYIKPVNPGVAGMLRDDLKELMDRKAEVGRLLRAQKAASRPTTSATRGTATQPTTGPTWTEKDDQKIVEIQKKLSDFVKRPMAPAITETVRLNITVDKDVTPGQRELRLSTPAGLTNPLVFDVSSLNETIEDEMKASAAAKEMWVELPVVVNGQIMPGDVDRVRFRAKQGQKMVAVLSARRLMPYIADAVPGWFQATMALLDATGKEITFNDDFRFSPDPVICYEIPADGEYMLEVRDSIYRGREDFVYRLEVGELTLVTSISPMGGPLGQPIIAGIVPPHQGDHRAD